MKRLVPLMTAATLAATMTACGSDDATTGGGGDAAEPLTMRVADTWADTHPMAAAIDEVFVPMVEEGTDGAVDVQVFHASTLGNEADLWDGVRNGTLEVAVVGTPMNEEFPTMLISDWPFLYRDLEHAQSVWTGDIAEDLSGRFHEQFPETYILGWGPNSARTFTSSEQLTSIDDFQGQQFRMPGNPIHIGIAENLGASAQVIPLGELFTALETGVVDGQDNGMVTVVSEGLYEAQEYLYETNHIIATLELIVNADVMDGLSEDDQQVVREAATATAEAAWEDYVASIDEDRAFLEENGITVTQLSDADREQMVEQLQPLTEQLLADNDWAPELTQQISEVS